MDCLVVLKEILKFQQKCPMRTISVQTANVLMPDPWIVRPEKKRGPVPAKERALVITSIENPTMRGATLREIFLSEIGTKFLCKNTGLVLDGVYLFFALLLSPENSSSRNCILRTNHFFMVLENKL